MVHGGMCVCGACTMVRVRCMHHGACAVSGACEVRGVCCAYACVWVCVRVGVRVVRVVCVCCACACVRACMRVCVRGTWCVVRGTWGIWDLLAFEVWAYVVSVLALSLIYLRHPSPPHQHDTDNISKSINDLLQK
jgi:hypothetical protein